MFNKIIIHHSLTKDGKVVDWQAIRRYHMGWAYMNNTITASEAQQLIKDGKRVKSPWTDIGYHFGIELVNDTYEILAGRYLNQIGAHTRNQNHDSIGICCVGNFDIEYVPDAVMQKAVKLVKSLMFVFNIGVDNVFGHHDFDPSKSCPGKNFSVQNLKNKLK